MIWRLWVDFHLEELKPVGSWCILGSWWDVSRVVQHLLKAEQQLLQRIFAMLPDVVFKIVVLIFSVLFVKRPLVLMLSWETDVTSRLDDAFVTVRKKRPWSKKGWFYGSVIFAFSVKKHISCAKAALKYIFFLYLSPVDFICIFSCILVKLCCSYPPKINVAHRLVTVTANLGERLVSIFSSVSFFLFLLQRRSSD